MAKPMDIQLVERLDVLLVNDQVVEREKKILMIAQENLKRHQSDVKVAQQLKQELSLLATKQNLSAPLIDLLAWLSKSYLGWGQRGMGLTTIL